MSSIDAVVMGRNTFEIVKGFAGEWPYSKKVFVLSSSIRSISIDYKNKVEIINDLSAKEICDYLNDEGYNDLYIDGGTAIRRFLKEKFIDEMIVTTLPILLGAGVRLFGQLCEYQRFDILKSELVEDSLLQTHYIRKN